MYPKRKYIGKETRPSYIMYAATQDTNKREVTLFSYK